VALGDDVQVSIDIYLQDLQVSWGDLCIFCDDFASEGAEVIDIDSFGLFFAKDLLDS
jgi:hypothetical protein